MFEILKEFKRWTGAVDNTHYSVVLYRFDGKIYVNRYEENLLSIDKQVKEFGDMEEAEEYFGLEVLKVQSL